MRSLSKKGYIRPRNQAEPISPEEEHLLWTSSFSGRENLQQLLNTVVYLLRLHLALHAVIEHKQLKLGENGQIQILFDEHLKLKYMLYKENASKNH